MEIPYTLTARPDTGLYNGKLGVWLFLASEVMLFGALFTAYLFMRIGADEGTWPAHMLNVWLGLINTALLIISSITMVYAWVALKERKFNRYPGIPRRHHHLRLRLPLRQELRVLLQVPALGLLHQGGGHCQIPARTRQDGCPGHLCAQPARLSGQRPP